MNICPYEKCYCEAKWESDCKWWPYPRTRKFERQIPGVKGRVRFGPFAPYPNRLYGVMVNKEGEAV